MRAATVAVVALALSMAAPSVQCGDPGPGADPIIDSGLHRALRLDAVEDHETVFSLRPRLTAWCPAASDSCRHGAGFRASTNFLPGRDVMRLATGVAADEVVVIPVPTEVGARVLAGSVKLDPDDGIQAKDRDDSGQRWVVALPPTTSERYYEIRVQPADGKDGYLSFVVRG